MHYMLKATLPIMTIISLFASETESGVSDGLQGAWEYMWNEDSEEDTWPPSFCNDLDCPKFEVLEKTQDFEKRRYTEIIHWVSTKVSTIDYDSKERRGMFMKLFYYISGSNVDGKKIAMTVPVTTYIEPGNGPACETNFTMSFFLADPNVTPEPTDDKVFVRQVPPTTFYVRSFSGYANSEDYVREGNELMQQLKNKNYNYKEGVYYTVGYDAPYKFWNRHNEFWLVAE